MKTKTNLAPHPEYLVYILSNKKKDTITGIAFGKILSEEGEKKKFTKLIYFEKFQDRTKALRRKIYFDKMNNSKRLKIIKVKNPELLNLIFTLKDINFVESSV
ncbi:MAG: hypothetical protein ABI840_09100 [bacterium]